MDKNYGYLVGIPYSLMNCWDIAVKFYADVLGVGLDGIYSGVTPPRTDTKYLIYSNIGDFDKVEVPQFGDLVILRVFGIESHIAVYVGDGKMLHTTKTTGSVIERIEKWKNMLVGFYRVKEKHD